MAGGALAANALGMVDATTVTNVYDALLVPASVRARREQRPFRGPLRRRLDPSVYGKLLLDSPLHQGQRVGHRRPAQRRGRRRCRVPHLQVQQRLPGEPDRRPPRPVLARRPSPRRPALSPGRRGPVRHRYRRRRVQRRSRRSTLTVRSRPRTVNSTASAHRDRLRALAVAARSPSPARPSPPRTPSRSARSRRSAPRSVSLTPSRVCTCTAPRFVRPEALVVASVKTS